MCVKQNKSNKSMKKNCNKLLKRTKKKIKAKLIQKQNKSIKTF